MKRKIPVAVFRPLYKKKTVFLHIPKTGGTAIKNALIDREASIDIFHSHNRTLASSPQPVCFVLRDPLARFCSGYWERKHSHLREMQARDPVNQYYARSGYGALTEFEQDLFQTASTPDQLISWLKASPLNADLLAQSASLLEMVTRPLTFWLGTLAEYQEKESKVVVAIDMPSLTTAMMSLFDVDLDRQTPFMSRSHTAFDIKINNQVSACNQAWFKTVFRPEDYLLVDYIKTRPYFYAS